MPPWELAKQPIFWLEQANIHRTVIAEVEAERQAREDRRNKNTPGSGGSRRSPRRISGKGRRR